MRTHRFISNSLLDPDMRPVNVSLDSTTWELAKAKANFSGWVRRKLLEEVKFTDVRYEYQCTTCNAKFFKGKSKVQGIMMVVDCIECGYGAMKTGVTE
jgi:DNA-directed RNA polymerase subunit RPC12/RpoP